MKTPDEDRNRPDGPNSRPDRRPEGGQRGGRGSGANRRPPARTAGRSAPGPTERSQGPRGTGSQQRPERAGVRRDAQEPVRLLGPRRSGPLEPPLPEDVTFSDLDRAVRAELRSLSKANAEIVGRHLVMAGRLLLDDSETAYAHAMAAQRRAGRIAVVREAVGVTAYHCGLWAEALGELRAARRMSGLSHLLPLMADAERGLGRPERALELAVSPEAGSLSTAERVDLAIVVSGARRDLGEAAAGVLALRIPELTAQATHAFTPRLRYAYADALLEAGRPDEALDWFAKAAATDLDDETDAEERLADLQGLVFVDLDESDEDSADGSDDSARPTS